VVAVWLGAGGSGKTWCYTQVIKKLFELYLPAGAFAAMAPTHAAARLLGPEATTMHRAMKAVFGQKWDKDALGLKGEAFKEMRLKWNDALAAVIDEISMAVPEVYHGTAYRVSLTRYLKHELDSDMYMKEWFGKLPLGLHLGDFLQLRPAGKRSLCEWIDDATSAEELLAGQESTASELGRNLFRDSITHVVQFTGTGRFSQCASGQDLVQLLACMRESKSIPEELWQKVKAREIDLETDQSNMFKEGCFDGIEGAFWWELVTRLQQMRAIRQANAAGKRVYYVQAVDAFQTNSASMTRHDVFEALKVVNMTETG
jgi:hypothetical protein